MKIKNIEIQGHVILGPMAGVTTLAYRDFMKPFGVGLSYSEMISDCGIDYGNSRTFEYLQTSKLDRPVGLQLFGFSAQNAVKAIEIIEKCADFDVLDINLGCPVFKVTKTGAGSAWLKDPVALEEYMKEICRVSTKPVSAKIRLGWDENSINVYEVAEALERAGVSFLTIHCRTKAQGYTGEADYHAISDMKKHIKIPFCVSGDIFTPQKAKEAMDITGADCVMVARGGVGNPFLVTQINHYLDTGELLPSPSVIQQAIWAEDLANKVIDQKGEIVGVRELRGIIPHFFSGFPGYKKVRNEIATKTHTKEQLMRVLHGIQDRGTC